MCARHTVEIDVDGTAGRRRFLRWTGVLGAGMLAGCAGGDQGGGETTTTAGSTDEETDGGGGGGGGGSQDTETETEASTGGVRTGGTLRVSVQRNPATVNPVTQGNLPEYMFTSLTYSNLTQVNEELGVEPQLATDWESNDDATQWTFDLNPDATFHYSGEQVTATDVKATFEKTQDPDVGSVAQGSLGEVESFEAVDDTTFRINLARPFVATPQQLSIPQFRILPAEIVEDDERFQEAASNEFGSGPFVQDVYNPGDTISVTRYDDYFLSGEDGVGYPYLDAVEIKSYPEASGEMTALSNEQIDVVPEVSSGMWSRAEGMDAVTHQRPGTSWPNVVMRCDTAPFDDPKVRKAFRVAVDREAMLQGARNGLGTVVQDNLIPPNFPAHVELDSLGPDRERARQLLAEAGYEGGMDLSSDFDADLTLYAANSPSVRTPLAVQLQEQLQEIGVDMEIQQVNYDNYLSNVWTKAPFYVGFYVTRLVPVTTYNLLLVSDASWNETQWNNEEFDEAVATAQAATTREEQNEALATCQRLLYEEGPMILPFVMDELGARHDYVRNYYQDVTSSYPIAHTWRMWLTEDAPES
jgi:peptide/nickel transport system substrate-binding protein